MKKVLITGGAGFIGSHLCDGLIERGYRVTVFDNLDRQVHPEGRIPDYLNRRADFINGDIRDYESLKEVVKTHDYIFHLASAVGVGQSQYEISRYTDVNIRGTANLLDILVNTRHRIKKIIVAASMSSYGEGLSECKKCGVFKPALRNLPEGIEMKRRSSWEIRCPVCGKITFPVPTHEKTSLDSNSIYAITKKEQEEMSMLIGKTYGIPVVSLRFFNVYGPRQSLFNPYTGVTAIFLSRIKNKRSPVIFEDGLQTRDFIWVKDVVKACIMVLENEKANFEIFNVGTGRPSSILEIAEILIKFMRSKCKPVITYKFRKGDVRHCFADITKIKNTIGFSAEVSLEQLQREGDQWEAYRKATERSLNSARSGMEERLRQLEMVKQNLHNLSKRQQEAERQISEVDGSIADLKSKEQECNQQQNEILAKIQPLMQAIEAADSQFEGLNSEVQELQRILLSQEQSFAQVRIALTRQQERFDAMRGKIEGAFGLVAFEYEEDMSGQPPLPLDGMVETLPNIQQIPPDLEENIKRYRQQLRRLGPVNQESRAEYEQVKERYHFMQEQIADLLRAEADILELIQQLDQTIRKDFLRTYEAVAEEFKNIFMRLFKGGSARLFLTDSDDIANAGIEIEARLPGKRTQGLSLLSGGERSLTAVALIFALLKVSPTPFCVLDEVDAMLDEANVGRFQEILRELSQNTQFIIVTHNRNTVQVADIIYGVTLGRDSTSQVMSLKLEELDRVIGSG